MLEKKAVTSSGTGESGDQKMSGKARAFWMALILVLQVLTALAVAQFLILPAQGRESRLFGSSEARGSILMMDDLVVTLNEPEGTRYLKVSPGLECENSRVEKEVKKRMPELRDLLIAGLSKRSLPELSAQGGREHLKKQLLEEFNGTLRSGELLNIYFSDFVMQ